MPQDLLVLAAFDPELAVLRPALGEAMTGVVGGVAVAARTTGIGLAAASVKAARLLATERPRRVVLLGTCGAYRGSPLAIGDVAVARRVRLVDPSSLVGVTQFPEPMSVTIETSAALLQGFVAAGGRSADVATTLAITVDEETAARIAASTATQVEHLESYGVAVACADYGVPFTAVLGVSNFVGAQARVEWRANHRVAAAMAVRCVLSYLGVHLGVPSESPAD